MIRQRGELAPVVRQLQEVVRALRRRVRAADGQAAGELGQRLGELVALLPAREREAFVATVARTRADEDPVGERGEGASAGGKSGPAAADLPWLPELQARYLEYAAVVERADLAPSTRATYLRHAQSFIRWLQGDFTPGGGTR